MTCEKGGSHRIRHRINCTLICIVVHILFVAFGVETFIYEAMGKTHPVHSDVEEHEGHEHEEECNMIRQNLALRKACLDSGFDLPLDEENVLDGNNL